MKNLVKFLSDNRKFITAFIGLYVAYSVGFNHGSASLKNTQNQLTMVSADQQHQQAAVSEGFATSGGVFVNPSPEASSQQPLATASNQTPQNSNGSTNSSPSSTTNSVSSGNQSATSTASLESSVRPSATPLIQAILSKTIDASGKYSYMGQDVTYNLAFKNTGGSVSGTVGGVCNGTVDGSFDGRDGGDINGAIKGSCGMGFLSKKLDAKYTGKVYLSRGVMNITVSGEIPFVQGDQSFSLSFNP